MSRVGQVWEGLYSLEPGKAVMVVGVLYRLDVEGITRYRCLDLATGREADSRAEGDWSPWESREGTRRIA